jgi:hypothetical protein
MIDKYREDVSMNFENRHAKGYTLPVDNVANRADVLRMSWGVGFPIWKYKDRRTTRLVQDPHPNLGGISGLRDHIPVVVASMDDKIRTKVKGRKVAYCFDAKGVLAIGKNFHDAGSFLESDSLCLPYVQSFLALAIEQTTSDWMRL